MSQSNVKFIAADMDGTLLDEQSNLDPEFFNIYQQLTDKNIMFAAASGRQYYSLLETFSPVKDDIMFIAENGTLVMHHGKELYSSTLHKDAIKAIIKKARLIENSHIVLCGKKSAYIETNEPHAIKEIQKYYHRCEYVDDLLAISDDFIKIAICHFDGSEENVYPTINDAFGHKHKVVVSAKIWLDIMNANASKGAAIKYLQNTLGFNFEETMSFGDYLNDLEMLQASYYSYAMDNAHAEVKKIARYRAPSNQHSGVITIIKEHITK